MNGLLAWNQGYMMLGARLPFIYSAKTEEFINIKNFLSAIFASNICFFEINRASEFSSGYFRNVKHEKIAIFYDLGEFDSTRRIIDNFIDFQEEIDKKSDPSKTEYYKTYWDLVRKEIPVL